MPDELHPRERLVLEGLADGLTLAEIAAENRLSLATVKSWTERLYETLGARRQAHAVAIGYRLGLLPLPVVVEVVAGVCGG